MDEPYLYRAMRYAELNPVRAKVVQDPTDYRWSSARAHVLGKPDQMIGRNPLGMSGREWTAYLKEGLVESETNLFRDHNARSTPLGSEDFLRKIGAI
jgi:putative transposase